MGRYYLLEGIPCRKVLEIKRVITDEPSPDLLVIMMNPGSSAPLNEGESLDQLVLAKPDATQDQIMRVMDAAEFNFARVINLSDVRTPKSKELQAFLISDEGKVLPHSIFDPSRADGLAQLLPKDATYLLGWGVHYTLRPYAQLALKILTGQQLVGWHKAKGKDWEYYHPLPPNTRKQEEWLHTVLDKLR